MFSTDAGFGDRGPIVTRIFNQFMRDAAGMVERHAIATKAGEFGGGNFMLAQAVHPKISGPHRDRLLHDFRLVQPAPPIDRRLAERKGGDDRRRVAGFCAVIQVIDRQHAVKQHGALDRIQAQFPGMKIEILLHAVCRQCQMVIRVMVVSSLKVLGSKIV